MLRRVVILSLVVLFVLEVFVIIRVGGLIGFAPTFLLLVAGAVAGVWLMGRAGRRSLAELSGRLVGGAPAAGGGAGQVRWLVAGLLLAVPGFVTDVLGLLVLTPPARPLLDRWVRRGLAAGEERMRGAGFPPPGAASGGDAGEPVPGAVIRGEVLREDD